MESKEAPWLNFLASGHARERCYALFCASFFPPRSITLALSTILPTIFGITPPPTCSPVPPTTTQRRADVRAEGGDLMQATADQDFRGGATNVRGLGAGGGASAASVATATTSHVSPSSECSLSNGMAVSAEGAKAFLQAARDGDTEALQASLRADSAHLHSRDRDGRTSFILAVASGQVDAAEMLLVRTYEAGLLNAHGYSRFDSKSALMWASKLGMVSIVHKLLDLSACVELTDEDGMTALMLAAANRQEKAAEILLTPTLTADASLLETRDSNCGRSVLMFSSMSGLTGFCSLLLSCGARPELLDNNDATSLMLALQHATAGIDALADILLAPTANAGLLDVQDITAQRSALHTASSQGLSGVVKKLLDLNANPALTDKDGNTPLLLAITHGHTAAADVLLVPSAQAGMLQVQGAGKMSALCRACEQGLAGIVERLLDLDANPALTDKDGNTPLILAIVHGHAAAAEKLLSQKAQVVALDVQSAGSLRSAIMRASERGMVAMVEKLLSMGAKVGLKDKYGKTALILALENSHEAVAEILLPQTAQAGALDVQGTGYLDRKSALMISSKLGLSSTAEKLLRLHANAKLKDSQGKTALDLARENGHEACVSLLQLHARPV